MPSPPQQEQQPGQGGAPAGDGLHPEHQGGAEREPPGTRNQIGSGAVTGLGTLQPRQGAPHITGRIGRVGCDQHPLGCGNQRGQEIIPPPGDDLDSVAIEVPATIGGRDAAPVGRPHRNHNQSNSGAPQAGGSREHDVLTFEALAIGQHHHHLVSPFDGTIQHGPRLNEGRSLGGAALAGYFGVERVELQRKRTLVEGERREQIWPGRKGDQPEPITVEILHQPTCDAEGTGEPIRGDILRQH